MLHYYRLLLGLSLSIVTLTVQAIPPIQHWQTDNGARVYFVPAPELPIVDVSIVFDAGSTRDGEQHGIASLTNNVLSEGAGGVNADELAGRFADVGAQFGNSASRDRASLRLRSLQEVQYLQPALATLQLILTQPDFPADAVARLRDQQLAGLKIEQQRPGSIASRAFYKAIYGEHPYANPSSGKVGSVQALTPADVKAFYQRYYVANNAVVAIVGALSHDEAQTLVSKLFAQLPAGEAAPPLPPVAALDSAQTINLQHPASQTHILLGQPGKDRYDPDYFALYVGNHILGGSGLVSLITQQIREQRGLAYSAYSYFIPMQQKGPFIAGLQTQNANKQEALTVLRSTLTDFVNNGVTAEQLAAAKKNITGGFPLRIDSNRDILSYIATIGFYNMPLDHLHQFNQRVEAVTAEQIKAAFQRHFQLDKLVTVMVGGTEGGDATVSQ